MTILIENLRTIDQASCDIYIEDNLITRIGEVTEQQRQSADLVLDGTDKLAVPGLMNGHTHGAMTLLRGWGDDLPLDTWLNERIWPAEARLTEGDVYWGTRLACLEMIRSGTTFFNDMYWNFSSICRAIEDSGLRAIVSGVFIDHFDLDKAREQIEASREHAEEISNYPDRISYALGPHALYTVSKNSLEWAAQHTREHDLPLHIHVAETEKDVKECREKHDQSPVQYLNELGVIHERTVIAHGVWVDEEDIRILAESGASVVHNPLSNYKLSTGTSFPYKRYIDAGVPVCLGTDGAAANNSYNLFEEIKMTALLQKGMQNDPEAVPADEAWSLATDVPADVFRLDAGRLEEGKKADLILIDLNHPALQPLHDVYSQLAYASPEGAVDTTICDGEVLMENRNVPGEQEILENASKRAHHLVEKV